jgi:hypothetical protein
MPLEVEVLRNGKMVKHTWDYFTLSCMYTAAIKETAPDTPINGKCKNFGELPEGGWVDFSMAPIYYLEIPQCPLVSRGKQTLTRRHEFRYDEERTVIFEAGDILRAWRSSK